MTKMSNIIRILQITDLHLFESPESSLLEIKTYETLQAVVSNIKNEQLLIKPDIIIVSGDISQDYSENSYKLAKNIIDDFNCPTFAIPGNHDEPNLFKNILSKSKNISCSDKKIICDGWRIILLNTQVPGKIYGDLTDNELLFLKRELAIDQTIPTLIFLHHHVLPVNSAWLNRISLTNANAFLETIDHYTNIKAIVCGHIHQEFDAMYNDIHFLATPSTCFQFATNSVKFKLDSLMPGYRWFELHSDGTYTTKIIRIKDNQHFIPDVNNQEGY